MPQNATNTDLYFAGSEISADNVRALQKKLAAAPYRKLVTFPEHLEAVKTLAIGKVGLVNYRTDRLTQRRLREQIDLALQFGASEIELYWVPTFGTWGAEKWREMVEDYANQGVLLRATMDIAGEPDDTLTKRLGFLRAVGITDIAISSGRVAQIISPSQWQEKRRLVPTIFRVKAIGVKTKADADAFLGAGVRFIGTRELS